MLERNNHEEGATTLTKVAAMVAADRQRQLEIFDQQTGGRLRPRHLYLERAAGSLAMGECVIEPHLGSVRVAGALVTGSLVHLAWSDDFGPCRAAGRYPAGQTFPMRTPAPQDQLVIRQAIDQARRRNADIDANAARLIAAHLYLGPRSALYRFAMIGAFEDDRLFDELQQLHQHRERIRPWVQALARFCVGREDRGPVPAWSRDPEGPSADEITEVTTPKKISDHWRSRACFGSSRWSSTSLSCPKVACGSLILVPRLATLSWRGSPARKDEAHPQKV